MQGKFDLFDELASELQIGAAQSLSNRDVVYLAQTSIYHLSLFKPMIDVYKLFHYVVGGNHKAVEAILKKNINLIFRRDKVTDYYGREFKNISSFEYSLWALDKHMWAKLIACIPSNGEGRKVFAQLVIQYNKVNTDGVTYRFNGKTITEKHFDFENTIIKELQAQVDLINAPGAKNWAAIDNQWREGVGGAQKQLPMHIVDEYCSNESFDPVPKFISQPISTLKKFDNWMPDNDRNWFSVDSKIGLEFAVFKGWRNWIVVFSHAQQVGWAGPLCDLNSLKALCEVRTLDFSNLKSQLEEHASLDNHLQVIPM